MQKLLISLFIFLTAITAHAEIVGGVKLKADVTSIKENSLVVKTEYGSVEIDKKEVIEPVNKTGKQELTLSEHGYKKFKGDALKKSAR